MNTTELKALAEKATPGPWKATSRGAYWEEEEGDVDAVSGPEIIGAEFVEPLSNQQTTRGHCWYRDAAYIAAANPAAILELIAAHEDAQGEIRALRERVKALKEGLKKIKRGIDDELDQDWTCNSYHPNLIKAEVIARALLEQKP